MNYFKVLTNFKKKVKIKEEVYMIDENEQTVAPEETAEQYIEALTEMRRNSVPKAEYQKVVDENKKLIKAMINGDEIEVENPEPEVDVDALRKDILTKDMTNLEYATKVLELRNELLKRGEKDPFLPYGHNYTLEDNDVISAEKAASALQHCVDVAKGNPDIFQNELQRIMVDTVPAVKKSNNNRR